MSLLTLKRLDGAWERAGVLHRDVGGDNIMITQPGSGIGIDLSHPLSAQSPQHEDRTVSCTIGLLT